MTWTRPTSPAVTAHAAETVTVDDAFVTRFNRGRLHTLASPQAPRHWMTGAVHDADGRLVEASRRWWSGDRAAPVSVDPETVRVPPAAPRLDGTWRYAGHWTRHFGHFFVELLTNLWGPPSAVDGLLLHRTYRGGDPGGRNDGTRAVRLTTWQRDLLRLAGYDEPQVRVVRHRPLRVERLEVASRPVLLKSWAAPEAVDVWRRVSDAVGERGPAARVYLSRTLHDRERLSHHAKDADLAWNERLDEVFGAAGFEVVHPERLPIVEQLRVVRGARVLAGAAGSGLHLSAFAEPGTRVLEVGDNRSPKSSLPTQQMIDAACGHESAFVGYRDTKRLTRALRSV